MFASSQPLTDYHPLGWTCSLNVLCWKIMLFSTRTVSQYQEDQMKEHLCFLQTFMGLRMNPNYMTLLWPLKLSYHQVRFDPKQDTISGFCICKTKNHGPYWICRESQILSYFKWLHTVFTVSTSNFMLDITPVNNVICRNWWWHYCWNWEFSSNCSYREMHWVYWVCLF